MSDQADLIIQLIDRVSRTAQRIESAIGGINKKLGGVEKAAGTGSFLGTFFGSIASHAIMAATAVMRFGVAAVQSFAMAVAGAASLRETSIKAFEALRHGETGLAQFEKVKQVAIEMGTSLPETVKQFQKLAAAQFSMEESVVIFKRMQDLLRATGASAEVAERAILSITQIKAKGRLQAEELMQLNEAGLSMELVFKALAKNTGKSIAEVQKAMQAGQITAAEGIRAIQDAIGLKTGGKPPGAAALEIMSSTLTGLIDRVKNFGGILLDDIAKQLGPALETLKPIIEDVFAAMKGPEAKAVVQGIADAFIGIIAAVRVAWPLIKAFAGGFSEGFGEAFGALKEVGKAFLDAFAGGDIKKQIPLFQMLGKVAGQVAVGLIVIVGAMTALIAAGVAMSAGIVAAVAGLVALGGKVVAWLTTVRDRITAFESEMGVSGTNAATALINGLVNGILGGIPRVASSMISLGSSATSALSSIWKTGSPSKVFTDMGVNAGTSVGGGLTKSETSVRTASSSMGEMAAMSSGAAVSSSSSAATPAASGPTITFSPQVSINVGPGADGKKIGQDFNAEVMSSFQSMLDNWAPAT